LWFVIANGIYLFKKKTQMNKRKMEEILNIEPLKQTKKMYPCSFDDCEFETSKSIEMLGHRSTHYPNLFLCAIGTCESKLESQSLLTFHLKTHKNSMNKFECDYKNCTFTTKSHKEMQIHTITHSVDVVYFCGIVNCQETFESKNMLHQHREIHKVNGKYVCDIEDCKYSTKDATTFQNHRIGHLETRPFKCDNCVASFARQYQLDRHGLTHSGVREFVCKVEICKKTFRDLWSLDRHNLIKHSEFKGFGCLKENCGKKFTTKSGLTRHINSLHEEEKMFDCEECDLKFTRNDKLVQHIQDHHSDEVKRFKCDHCYYKTNHLYHLNRHIDIHEKQKSFEFGCDMQDGGTQKCCYGDIPCTIRCKTQLDLEYHIDRNHTEKGLGSKFESETKLAEFLTSKGFHFTRDRENTIRFTTCNNIDPSKKSARPDFYLICKSAELGVFLILENDEFAHRRTACDFQRLYNIVVALREDSEEMIPIVFVRFNPHHFQRNGVYHSMSLKEGHEKLYKVIQSITREQLIHDVNLIYVNYDRTDNKLDVFKDVEIGEYAEFFEKYVILDV
jgi:uncharacterized Zn-finger protein